MLEDELPDLLPELRPYQRRAAYWMLQRETDKQSIEGAHINFLTPFCVPVEFVESGSVMFYNPFRYVSLNNQYCLLFSLVKGQRSYQSPEVLREE